MKPALNIEVARARISAVLIFLGACGTAPPSGPPTFTALSKHLTLSCTFASCHSAQGARSTGGLDLATNPYLALLDVKATNARAASEGKVYVKSGDSANSFLFIKLGLAPEANGACAVDTPNMLEGYGGCMPQAAQPFDATTLAGIKMWIDSGAKND